MEHELERLREELARGVASIGVGDRPPLQNGVENYAAWRLRKAWQDEGKLGPDHAVLLRQLARWSGGRAFPSLPDDLLKFFEACGLCRRVDGVTTAEPFAPPWIGEILSDGIDPVPSRRMPDERSPAEGYLRELKYSHWASPAQREAVWLALTAPPGSTNLIALPTGAGKSLCFQALARFGGGLTVVVVPTVALAYDHLRSARVRFAEDSRVNASAFSADDKAQSALDAVSSRSCRLLFTSPEACVSGRLRTVLEKSARDGWLENLVIDEAHLIETWGMDFRVDFQMLSSLRRTWQSEVHSQLRTTLLSATFTADCRNTLRTLYWDEGSPWRELISQRLRPEITYFRHSFDGSDERDSTLLECMWHLPRPVILYTTEVEEAERLHQKIREAGFQRTGCFTGDTGRTDRTRLLDKWNTDRIDLMVATSAFGLGVDKPDVRAVVHACMPENLHRYYQEVGRGGRDGMSCVALLMDSSRDREVAAGLAPRLLKPETLDRRWESLWTHAVPVDPSRHEYKLYLDSRPANLFGSRTYQENIRWNKRLVLQLLRARKIELLGYELEYPPDDLDVQGPRETCLVRLGFPPQTSSLGSMIEAGRTEELRVASDGLNQLRRYLDGTRCISLHLADLYGRDDTIRVCGGCHGCRSNTRSRRVLVSPLRVPLSPRTDPQLTVVTNAPHLESNPRPLVRGLLQQGWRRFACRESEREAWLQTFANVDRESRSIYRLDALTDPVAFHVGEDEKLVILHGTRLDRSALDLRVGQHVIHLMAGEPLDSNGRYPLESEGARLTAWGKWDRVH